MRIVASAIYIFWGIVLIANLMVAVDFYRFNDIPEPIILALTAFLIALVIFVMVSCLRHLLSSQRRRLHKLIWFILITAGHIVGSTLYFFVYLRKEKQ